MITHEHPRLGKLVLIRSADELTQGDLERFNSVYQSLNGISDPFGKLVRAAAQAGWIVEPEIRPEDVESLPAKKVRWYGQLVDRLYDEATTVDPKSLTPSQTMPATAAESP